MRPASRKLGWPTNPMLVIRSELQAKICLRRITPVDQRVCVTDSLSD